mmetsp:Transcript_9076/g.27330  ORF Transcript_9076/g.27330 Transcript_9076/m.27330 type:complete len:243 (-) Transcript_9076:1136-1864(-)
MSASLEAATGVVSGSSHLIIPKRILAVVSLSLLGGMTGVILSNHLYARQIETFLHEKTKMVSKANRQLEGEQEDYRALFNKLTWQLDEDGGKGEGKDLSKEEIGGFHQLAQRLLEGLQAMQDLLEEKEFQLWEKEGLLEYQEERLLDSEDQEVQMALYINMLAQQMLALNLTLPEGLEEQPYYGQERARSTDDAAPGDDAVRRRRRLRADSRELQRERRLEAGEVAVARAHDGAQVAHALRF